METVLDTYGVIAFLENEPGAEKVGALLKVAAEHKKPLYLSLVNWGEVYYITYRNAGKSYAEEALRSIESMPIELVTADQEMTLSAAEFKANYKMSYADAFAAALAKHKKAQLVTGDQEFKQVEHDIKILWL